MKERPILMNGAMVRATLRDEASKTQTRRIVKGMALDWLQPGMFSPEYVASPGSILSPYGFAGDRLYVRETFFAYGRWETRHNEKKGRDEWHFVDMTTECDRAYQYAADNPDVPVTTSRNGGVTPAWWKRPAIHMPRAASRITLEVTGVRVERLQEISEADARAEGVTIEERHMNGYCAGETRPPSIRAFRELWESINGADSWDANPWVWVVEFRKLEFPC
ncbi:hypothetical protein NDK50_08285 [Paraburkholderia bryophila]|uniref:hypothetical protein n=1 Tax=Paraburkholderia bryophila TaxID=420952 RepID=UPI00234B474D|nr:hypothetical protein [Paraburkholderia bryophila]WCM21435.1 hypothetical protein NDK50_08285 [Paraburkholderia bryophila]